MAHWLQLISIVKDEVTVNQGHTGGGTVYLDGISVGSLPTYGRITFKATLGSHIITLTCPGSSSLQCNQNTERIVINITEVPCTPDWKCETPLNGYSSDGCGNRRQDSNCNEIIIPPPPPPPDPICTEGATRQVKCPTSGKMVTQRCTGNTWLTIKEDVSKCSGAIKTDYTKYIIIAVIIVILYFSFMKKG